MKNCQSIFVCAPAFPPFVQLLVAVFCLNVFVTTNAFAQEDPCKVVLAVAKKEYQQGLFDKASYRLSECISRGTLSKVQEKDAYLLLGQIYYANLEEEKARNSVRRLLEEDPSLQLDPEEYKSGFIDLVGAVRQEITTQASAPVVPQREGFWISVGVGPAEGNIQCDCPLLIDRNLPQDHPWRGGPAGSFFLGMGGTISPKLQIGGEINGWSRSQEQENDTFTSTIALLSFVAKYYPKETGNFFLKGGLGFGAATLENNAIKLQAGGAGLQFGLGYDILLGHDKKVALTPQLNLNVLYANEDVVTVTNTNSNISFRLKGPTEPSFIQLGIAVSWL